MQEARKVRTITTTEFEANCLRLMDEIDETDTELVITKDGRPVSRLVPYRGPKGAPFGRDRDIIKIHGDIIDGVPY